MARYRCSVCGYVFDEEAEGRSFSDLKKCPVCGSAPEKFARQADEAGEISSGSARQAEETGEIPSSSARQADETGEIPSGSARQADEAGRVSSGSARREKAAGVVSSGSVRPAAREPDTGAAGLSYDPDIFRKDPSVRFMDEIHEMALTGRPVQSAMGAGNVTPSWDDILILGAQLDPAPLGDEEPVDLTAVIGKDAKRPMILRSPVYVSHMSFGALSREVKIALARGSAKTETAVCSGEGGILPEERAEAYQYIFEYVPNRYSATDENMRNADAVEIKIGQSAKPGLGGHLPGAKVTPEIAAMRGKKPGEDIRSPSKFPELHTKEDLRRMVSDLRRRSDGRPIGVKIAAGHIERDLEAAVFAEPDFITVDGRGGGTASSPYFLKEAAGVPTIYALYRARKYLDACGSDISLVITGGLRVSADFVKAIAMGADAVAVATAPLMAAGCQQYRICGSGRCPVGIATQDPELRRRLDVDAAAERVAGYFRAVRQELEMFARVTGHARLRDLSVRDLCTVNREISEHTNIPHA